MSERQSDRRAIAAATVGNMLEWYDFTVYGYFAVILAKLFFPAENETASLLATVAAFGAGFVMRPVGALVLGVVADRRGRKAALTVTILLMALGTAMIGFAPTYASAGALGPSIVVAARLIQGFSAGGEIGGATAFLIEHARPDERGFIASWQQASQAFALLLGSLVGASVTGVLGPEAVEAWGWRVPFLLGLLIGPVGFYIRARTQESQEFLAARQEGGPSPLATAVREHGRAILAGFGITITWTVSTYAFLLYMPTYAVRQLGLAQNAAFVAGSIGGLTLSVLVPMFGAYSDRVGRKPILLGAAIGILILTYPTYAALNAYPSIGALIAAEIVFAVLIAAFTGPAPAAMAELYPAQVRATGLSIAYNFAVTIFGGFAPFIITWAIAWTGSPLAPAWYVLFAAGVSAAAVLLLPSKQTATPERRA
jgi:MHS family proline/betaine transporter-like MFS transporter